MAEFKTYDLIVQGVVNSIEVTEGHLKTITLEVKRTYKGEVTKSRVEISTPKRLSYCGLNIGVYDEWIIYAYKKDGVYQTNSCTRSSSLPPRDFQSERVEDDLKFLNSFQTTKASALVFLNSNRGNFRNIVTGKHEEYDAFGYVDSLQFGFISIEKVPGVKLFSTVFSSEEDMDYVEVQELQFAEIVEVQQKENHLDLISKSGEGAEKARRKVKLCMDYNNDENLKKMVSRIKEMCYRNETRKTENR